MKSLTAKLTPNEVELLTRLADGESVKDLADSWGTSATMVYHTFEKARSALGARTRYEAIAIWVRDHRWGETSRPSSDGRRGRTRDRRVLSAVEWV